MRRFVSHFSLAFALACPGTACDLSFLEAYQDDLPEEGLLLLTDYGGLPGDLRIEPEPLPEGQTALYSLSLGPGRPAGGNLQVVPERPDLLVFEPSTHAIATGPAGVYLDGFVHVLEDTNSLNEIVSVSVRFSGTELFSKDFPVLDRENNHILPESFPDTLAEGTTALAGVSLANPPGRELTVSVASSLPDALTVVPETVVFSDENYSAAQTLVLVAPEDADAENELVRLLFSAPGLPGSERYVRTADNDTLSLILGPPPAEMNEGQSTTIPLGLSADPGTTLSVWCFAAPSSSMSVTPAELSFSSAGAQTLSLNAIEDTNARDETVSIVCDADGALSAHRETLVRDKDTLSIVLSGEPNLVTEGEVANLQVRLSADPGESLTVTPNTSNVNSLATVGEKPVFDGSNWSVQQTIFLKAFEDANNVDEIVLITLSVPQVASSSFVVNVQDNDP